MNNTEIVFKKLNHIQVCIPHGMEDKAREFYAGILKFKELEKPESLKKNGGLWFEVADIQFHIGIENETAKSKRHPAFEVENIDSARQYLESHNIKIKDEIEIPNQKRFSFLDPWDNRIELLEITG